MFKGPDQFRQLDHCGTLLRFWHHLCGNVSHCALNRWHGENLSLLSCDDVPLCGWFLVFWRLLLPSEGLEPPMRRDTGLTTWKIWIHIRTTVRTQCVTFHNVASPHVDCTVQFKCGLHCSVQMCPAQFSPNVACTIQSKCGLHCSV
jgi:hypothetical protein